MNRRTWPMTHWLNDCTDLPPPQSPSAKPMTGWSAAELLAADFPEPTWAVPGFVPVGLTVLAGRPKVGKSWLALQIAIAKGTGGVALNQRVTPGRVLYLALEDNGRRLRDRAVKQGMPASATIRFETLAALTQGGLELLAQAIDAEGYALSCWTPSAVPWVAWKKRLRR